MKKFAWIISVLLLIAVAFQMPYSKVKTASTQKENTKQYVVKEETPNNSAIKVNQQFAQSSTTPLSFNNTTPGVLCSNRLMNIKFIQQTLVYLNIKPVLFAPTYLKVRVLRL